VLDETGKEIPIVDFVNEYMAARGLAFKADTITSAFERCGICPFNPNIFTDADFAPSVSYSTCHYAPSSYPPKFYGEEDHLEDDAIGSPLVGSEEAEIAVNDDEADMENDKDEGTPFTHQPTFSSTASPSQPSTSLSSDSTSTLRKRKRSELEAEIFRLGEKLDNVKWHAQAAQMHATMAGLECEELNKKINTKERRKEAEPTVSVAGVWWMTGPVGRATMDAHNAEVKAKDRRRQMPLQRSCI